MSQYAIDFQSLDTEIGLARALHAKTGRDLFAGVSDPKSRQAAARIAIVMNGLQREFGRAYESIYGEPLPEVRRLTQPQRKGTHA